MTNAERIEAARQSIRAGELAGLSERTMAKRWKAFFAAEDKAKREGAWL